MIGRPLIEPAKNIQPVAPYTLGVSIAQTFLV
jgi:hypothetical protein